MNKKMSKRQRDIKSKLMAAICMLLVSSIMMVSTTYAWFTLSTAPEVTGISTAVGANGNLEMALMPANGNLESITSSSGDGADTKPITEKNVTWGNLVDLGSTDAAMSAYGLNKITLYPSELNIVEGKIQDTPLKTPVYGADGRVKEVIGNTFTATHVGGKFNVNTDNGVRAVGVSSGMSQRELDYRNALSSAATFSSSAATKAKAALELNGGALASIAIAHGLDANAKFTPDEVAKLGAMITSLEESMVQIDNAYKQYILAFAASGLNTNELAYTAVKGFVETAGSTTASVLSSIAGLTGENVLSAVVPDYVNSGITAYNTTAAAVATARTNYTTNVTNNAQSEYEWSDIDDVVNGLADSSKMTVNGMTVQEVKDDKQALIDDYLATNRLTVTVATGAGVFADVADQCGDYKAQVKIEGVKVGEMTLNTNAWMETATTKNSPYLTAVGTDLAGNNPPASTTEEKTLSEMYGYIIDMAFRTNAADSDLQLQVDAVDRIYSDQTGADTMGHGSSMTFEATTTDLSQAQIKSLMDAIRIIFFDPAEKTIIAKAKLDAAAAETTADGLTAKMYLYTDAAGVETYEKVTDASDTTKTYYSKSTQTVYTEKTDVTSENFADFTNLFTYDGTTYTAATAFAEGTTYYAATEKDVYTAIEADDLAAAVTAGNVYVKTTTGNGFDRLPDTKIMGLTQNQATALSVLVYLDGTKVTNADVAFSGTTSMTGTMNLQFSSSATLVPMEYRALHQGTVTETPESGDTTP